MFLALLTTALAVLPTAAASTQPTKPTHVVVLSSATVRDTSGFVTALRIQLGRRAAIEAGPLVRGNGARSRLAFAVATARARGASVAVWLERRSGELAEQYEYVLHVIVRRNGGVQTRHFAMRAPAGPDADRALALKVSDALDQTTTSLRSATTDHGSAHNARLVPPPRDAARPWLELGGTLASGDGARAGQLGLNAAVGLSRVERFDVSVYVMGSVDGGVTATAEAGEVSTRELGGDVGVRLLRRTGTLAIGGDLRLGSRFIRARGTTALGSRGTVWVAVPRAVGALDGRVRVTPHIELRTAIGVELATRRRRFAVNDVMLLDVGRIRLLAQFSVVFSAR